MNMLRCQCDNGHFVILYPNLAEFRDTAPLI